MFFYNLFIDAIHRLRAFGPNDTETFKGITLNVFVGQTFQGCRIENYICLANQTGKGFYYSLFYSSLSMYARTCIGQLQETIATSHHCVFLLMNRASSPPGFILGEDDRARATNPEGLLTLR